MEHFKGTDVPIYVHEKELKHAFFSVATKTDLGVYLPKDLDLNLNWKPIYGDFLELAPGINIRHAPGHTPGLCIMQVNLPESGTWVFTTDQYHVKENFENDVPQGWLARDHDDWCRSHQMIKGLLKVCISSFCAYVHVADIGIANQRQHSPRPLQGNVRSL